MPLRRPPAPRTATPSPCLTGSLTLISKSGLWGACKGHRKQVSVGGVKTGHSRGKLLRAEPHSRRGAAAKVGDPPHRPRLLLAVP